MSIELPALIFDLDGTIIDSKPGILSCLRKLLGAHGLVTSGPLDRFVGPPVEDWVIELLPGGSEESRAALARDYRNCYDREGWMNSAVFEGVPDLLAELRKKGFSLYVCTSKRHHFAIRMLDAFKLTDLFIAIYADKAEYASHSKADLLAMLIRENGLRANSAWMIGDRIFDFEAARANDLRCIAAGWGYGPEEECLRADAVAVTPSDVLALLSRQTP